MKRHSSQIFAALFSLGLLFLACVALGSTFIPPGDVLAALFSRAPDAATATVVRAIRLPRVLCGLLAGAGLSVSGVVMQGVFRNPLADPGVLGVSSGAGMGALFAIALGYASFTRLPLSAFLGAMIAVGFILCVAFVGHGHTVTLVMSGMAVSALCSAVTSILLTYANQYQVSSYIFWTMGGLANRRWEHVFLLLPVVSVLTLFVLALAPRLDVLLLGDEQALLLGIRPRATRIALIVLASMLTATVVSVTGPIGFVGLVVPHVTRLLCGPSHRHLTLMSALVGAMFLCTCDLLVRLLGSINGMELSVGIVTALLGAPFFLFLLLRGRRDSL